MCVCAFDARYVPVFAFRQLPVSVNLILKISAPSMCVVSHPEYEASRKEWSNEKCMSYDPT